LHINIWCGAGIAIIAVAIYWLNNKPKRNLKK